jgi:hypothetical protein
MFHKCFNGKYKTGPFFYRKTSDGVLKIPTDFSPEAADLITRLLDDNPKRREKLGKHGAAAIKRHPFFHVSSFPICYLTIMHINFSVPNCVSSM